MGNTTLETYVKTIQINSQNLINYIKNATTGVSSFFTRGKIYTSSNNIIRPANTTAYAINDTVSGDPSVAWEFTNVLPNVNSEGYITKVQLFSGDPLDVKQYKLHLYSATVSPAADNASFALTLATKDIYIGSIILDAVTTGGTGSDMSYTQDVSIRLPISGVTTIYGILETLTIGSPISTQTYKLELKTTLA